MSSFFIRKNTPELREKLEAMGYCICPCCTFKNSVWLDAHSDDMSAHGIGYDSGVVYPYTLEGELEFFLRDNAEHGEPLQDCGESEELFLSMVKKGGTMKKILYLPLKKEWYEMIESGVKTEEYREIKPYWINRLAQCYKWCSLNVLTHLDRCKQCHPDFNDIRTNGYTHVKFSYGYTKRIMIFEIESITIGKGNPEWGAPKEDVFIIKLGIKYENKQQQ